MLQVIRVDEAVLLRLGLKISPVYPVVAGLGLKDLLELFFGLRGATIRRVLELALVVAADAAPVGEEDPQVLL